MASASLHRAKFELAKARLKQQICRRRLIQLQRTLLEVAKKRPSLGLSEKRAENIDKTKESWNNISVV